MGLAAQKQKKETNSTAPSTSLYYILHKSLRQAISPTLTYYAQLAGGNAKKSPLDG
jgi:hypothetical protein